MSLDTNSKSINDKNQQKLHGWPIACSLPHTRTTANGVAAMAMALHEAFIVCLFLSFVHGLPKIYCHPARWIRLALSHSLTSAHTHTHTQRYIRTLACAANFRKLTKLFSLLGFAGWIPMLIYEDCKLVRCFRTVHHPLPAAGPLYMCAIYTHIVRASICVCVCLDISFRLPLFLPVVLFAARQH